VVVVSALSAAAGYLLLDPVSGRTGALVQAFAAGPLLAMLTDTLLPEAPTGSRRADRPRMP
jgi:ZIP family zinc transporter